MRSKTQNSTGLRVFIVLLLLLTALVSTQADASGLREAVYEYESGVAVWKKEPTHIICDGCAPLPELSVVPRDYASRIVRVRAPQRVEERAASGDKDDSSEEPSIAPTLVTLYFDLDSFEIRESELAKLKELVSSIPGGMETRLEIHGYTCDMGTKEYNDVLAKRRAEAVYRAFVGLGIPEKDISYDGKGKCCYRSGVKALNRRVEVIPDRKREKGGGKW